MARDLPGRPHTLELEPPVRVTHLGIGSPEVIIWRESFLWEGGGDENAEVLKCRPLKGRRWGGHTVGSDPGGGGLGLGPPEDGREYTRKPPLK